MGANILILTHWSFKDALVQTYTLPYVEQIRKALPLQYSITVVTAEQERLALQKDEAEQINRVWKAKNMYLVAQPYKKFGFRKIIAAGRELIQLVQLIKRERIGVIHAFCTPAGSFGYMLSKLTDARLVIDSYEPHAEAMVENKTWKPNGVAYQILHRLEGLQTKRAESLIATSKGMKQYAKTQFGVDVKEFYVKPACVDLEKFSPRQKDAERLKALKLHEKIVCVYAGKLGGIYLHGEVFDLIKCYYEHWGERFRFLMLTNASEAEIDVEVTRIGIPKHVVIARFVLHEEVPAYLSLGDFALNPVKPVPTKRYCTSIKDGEYWAMGLPVVITKNISDDSGIIEEEGIGYVLKSLTQSEYKNAVQRIAELLQQDRYALQQKIRAVAERYRNFEIAAKIYHSLYKN